MQLGALPRVGRRRGSCPARGPQGHAFGSHLSAHDTGHMALAWLVAGQPDRALRAWWRVRLLAARPPGVGRGPRPHAGGPGSTGRCARGLSPGLERRVSPVTRPTAWGNWPLTRGASPTRLRTSGPPYAGNPGSKKRACSGARALVSEGRLDDGWLVLQGAPARWGAPAPKCAMSRWRCFGPRGAARRACDGGREVAGAFARPAMGRGGPPPQRSVGGTARPTAFFAGSARAAPRDSSPVRLHARVLCRLGRGRQAMSMLARRAYQCPADSEMQLDVAAMHIAQGHDDRAERHLCLALSRDPEQADLWAAGCGTGLRRGAHRARPGARALRPSPVSQASGGAGAARARPVRPGPMAPGGQRGGRCRAGATRRRRGPSRLRRCAPGGRAARGRLGAIAPLCERGARVIPRATSRWPTAWRPWET